jgi:hypothetical protein
VNRYADDVKRSVVADAAVGSGEVSKANVQRKASLRGMDFEAQTQMLSPESAPGDAIHDAAKSGTAGGGGAMPHVDTIQEAFGRHDVSGVRAHVGGAAKDASQQMGAEAFAYGQDVAFAGAPDLHTAAHEAAHVVQQRAGVSLYGGVGEVGDAYEQHADAVANAVVSGRSAEGLLDRMAGRGGGGAGRAQVQRKPTQKQPEQRDFRYEPDGDMKVTIGKTIAMRNEWYDTAIALLRKALNDNGSPPKDPMKVERLMFALAQQKQVGSDLDQNKNIIDPKALSEVFDETMPGRLTVMVADVLGLREEAAVQQMREAYIRLKNSQPWQTIQRDIAMRNDGGRGTTTVTSTITPVNQQFDETYHGTEGVVGKRFGNSGLGSMSPRLEAGGRNKQNETDRPTNLWHSKLEDSQGKLLFEAFRSGAFSDVAIKDPGEQAEVGQAKAKQVLEAMLLHRLKGVTNHQELWDYLTGARTYNATMISVNLLSEAVAMGFGDKKAAQQHHAAIEAVSGQELTYAIRFALPWDNGRVHPFSPKARFKIIDFGTGVNLASGKVGLGGATINQKLRNKDSMKELGLEFQTWSQTVQQEITTLSDDRNPDGYFDRLDRIKELNQRLQQAGTLLKEIKSKGSGHVGDYKLPQLIANLGHMMGHLVHFNCKSGKDRTGIMDAKSKHMAYELANQRATGGDLTKVPDMSRRDDNTEYRHQQMLWGSGNLQVLEKNVGGQSLKVADMSEKPIYNKDTRLKTDLGGGQTLRELQGLKKYTNIDHGMKPGKKGFTGKPGWFSARRERARALRDMDQMLRDSQRQFQLAKVRGDEI